MLQKTFEVIERIGSVKLSKGDRLIAESAARGAESAVDLLCRLAAKVESAVTAMTHAHAQPAD